MFVEHQSTSGAKISPAPVLHKSKNALLWPYGNYGIDRISTNTERKTTRVTLKCDDSPTSGIETENHFSFFVHSFQISLAAIFSTLLLFVYNGINDFHRGKTFETPPSR